MYIVIPLGELLNAEYDQEKLEESLQKFSCQRETDLEDFLKDKAILYENTNFGKTYLILDKEELDKGSFIVMAYFTIAQKSVDISAISNKQKRKMLASYPGRDNLKSIPAYLIGQLGRSDSYSSQQLSGTDILNECYNAISMAARIVGGNLIILECRECMFSNFYEKHGFKKLYNDLSKDKLYTLYLKVDFKDFWNKNRD